MKQKRSFSKVISSATFAICAGLASSYAHAVKESTITRPDGTVETVKTVKYYPTANEYIVFGLAIIVGAVLTFLGVRLIYRGMESGHASEYADADIDVANKTVKVKKISQGAVIASIGAIIILGSLYIMTT